jgi:hypothetical protein
VLPLAPFRLELLEDRLDPSGACPAGVGDGDLDLAVVAPGGDVDRQNLFAYCARFALVIVSG